MVIILVGGQWGDEGKGKVIDFLAAKADMVIRSQGGNNAGHTVITEHGEFKFQLMPSGILYPTCVCIIGNGVVVDPIVLLREISQLRERGIGPAYADKVRRIGFRIGDLQREAFMRKKLAFVVGQVKNPILTKLYDKEALDWDSMAAEYMGYAKQLDPYIKDTFPIIQEALDRKANILLEGAQATMLDLDFGTYPYVTSSNPTAGGALTGSGIPPTKVDLTIGVFKAYTSRVGYGPFPSELLDEVGDQIRERGHEFGTVTGRPRRIGWFDSAVARYSARLNGIGCAALMRLDILDEQPSLKICTSYDFRGKRFDHPVANISHYKHSKPIYEEMAGWETDIGAAREWDDLPKQCRDYVERIGELIGVPIELVGTGPRRDQFVTRGRKLFD